MLGWYGVENKMTVSEKEDRRTRPEACHQGYIITGKIRSAEIKSMGEGV